MIWKKKYIYSTRLGYDWFEKVQRFLMVFDSFQTSDDEKCYLCIYQNFHSRSNLIISWFFLTLQLWFRFIPCFQIVLFLINFEYLTIIYGLDHQCVVFGQDTPLNRGAFCQFSFRWIYYCHISKSTGKETGKMHLCALYWTSYV